VRGLASKLRIGSLGRRAPDDSTPLTQRISGTIIGDIDGPTAVVGPRGTIGALDGSWRFEWGAGADDRWHVAHDEVAVRQSRVDDTPVFETSMRVPGGDVVCRVASAADGMSRSLVVEFINASPGGVALGTVMHLATPVGRSYVAAAGRLSVDRSEIKVGETALLSAERRAGGVATAAYSDDGPDPWHTVMSSPESSDVSIDLGYAGGFAAMVFPLPHRASLQIRIAVDGDLSGRVASPSDIASGWRAITSRSATVEVPDRQMVEAWRRIVPDLVIAAGSPDPLVAAEVAPWLDLAGLHQEADRARATIVIAAEAGRLRGHGAAAAITALASRDLRAGEPSGLDQLIDLLLPAAGDATNRHTIAAAALVLRSAHPGPAGGLAALAASLPEPEAHQPETPVARGAAAVIGNLMGPVAEGSLDLLPTVPSDWFGQSIDVRNLATHVGRVSFSVRWHGSRPALLWEREGGPNEVTLTCSGLDPGWSSTERTAESLLGEPPDRG